MLVRDAMTAHAEWITPDISLTEVARKMRDENIGCLPVGENDRVIGMITDRDLACRAVAEGADPNTTKAREIMTAGITWCFEDEDVKDATLRMAEKEIHHIPVMSREKRMTGILSLSDLALRAPQDLFVEVSRLVARDASRHASASPLAH
jgi:CBS domain-containing protein